MSAVAADGLTRRFGSLVAVNNLTFEVPVGDVVGFVGPNGSGKSTTIRVLLGLIRASSGTGTVLGESIERPERFAGRVGALIDQPAFVGSLTGRDNLRSLAALRGLPVSRIDQVLKTVGLLGRGDDRASSYSLGMNSGSASQQRSCRIRSCSFSMNRPTGWTPPGSSRSASC